MFPCGLAENLESFCERSDQPKIHILLRSKKSQSTVQINDPDEDTFNELIEHIEEEHPDILL